jgi:rhodanese-related sulfurtransferase
MIRRLTCLLLFAALAGLSADGPEALTMAQVEAVLGKPGVYVYDVNTPEIWERGHLPGAIYINRPDIRRFLPRDKRAVVIFYCANRLCSASIAAAREAVRRGYRNAYVMPEGIFGWATSGRRTELGGTRR